MGPQFWELPIYDCNILGELSIRVRARAFLTGGGAGAFHLQREIQRSYRV